MASLTIRKLDDSVKAKLRVRAAENGRSMEEEARVILEGAFATLMAPPRGNMVERIRSRFEPLGGVVLRIPDRTISRPPVDFSGPEYGEYDDE
jgi:plasmid stability protein